MKKITIPVVVFCMFFILLSCKKSVPVAPDFRATATAEAMQTAVIQDALDDLAVVPGGTYTQTDGVNSFSHTISNFKMGKHEVTYDLWYTVYQWAVSNGYVFENAGAEGVAGTIGAAPTTAKYQPVTTVNWRDMIVWCNAYSQKSGLPPVYCSDSGFLLPIKDSTSGAYSGSVNATQGSFDKPYVNWNANGFRLPTEGEWQYAASYIDGVTWTPYNFGSGAAADYTDGTATCLIGWYDNCSGYTTHNVGGKNSNALGIYDMSGNVWELCWDWNYAYPFVPFANYKGASGGGGRVSRGGASGTGGLSLQVGFRSGLTSYDAHSDTGFRYARTY